MDLHALMGRFFNDKGEIILDPKLTLPGLAEMMYLAEAQEGTTDRVCLRYWDYSNSREGEAKDLTRKEVHIRTKAVAARLQQVGAPGDRVAILASNSPEYIQAFMGAMYAGMVPIPLYDPNEPGHSGHLAAVFAVAEPKLVLTNTASAGAVRKLFASKPAAERPRVLTVDALPDSLAESWVNPMELPGVDVAALGAPLDLPAFLQFTSGSTRNPAGVALTHRAILINVLQIFVALQLAMPLRIVSWLPLHHDMGIILAAFASIMGLELELMSPRDFIQQPARWLNQIDARPFLSAQDDTVPNVYAAVPNFALELAVRYGKAQAGDLDLSAIKGLVIGSEPVREQAVNEFYEAFKEYGLERNALRPSYGLAEASLLVLTSQTPNRPVFAHFDREALAAGEAKIAEGDAPYVSFASNGQSVRPMELTIVDPATGNELPDGRVGELWVSGGNVASGYLGREDENESTFQNKLGERLTEGSRVLHADADARWLATGDLAVIVDGETYITGRLKDLIVIAGRNHYPQDIEATAQETSAHVRPDSVAAFSVGDESTEELVLLIERADNADPAGDAEAVEAVRAAVTAHHGVTPGDIKILAPMEISRSSSGKIARRVAKKNYEA
ncbi:AMP-binding protein [Corynebacterium incognita]|uniref:AMP-binding protein n=1 Tax=Corynebacterium incognita TaxID=2754725 RepID=A0A7G7CRV1_9CORY|nr:FadD32-like long-chain-fatty-acid--AMP ligase [Corynebacterium incognita]QNE90317.1 AMP-binding protein [Corynebacterium incognita]